MKKIILLLALAFGGKLFSQEAKINFADSSIISGGTMSVKDFQKMRRISPSALTKVTSFNISYKGGASGLHSFNCIGNGWWYKLSQGMKPGKKIYFEDIKGFDTQGHHVKIPDIVIVLK